MEQNEIYYILIAYSFSTVSWLSQTELKCFVLYVVVEAAAACQKVLNEEGLSEKVVSGFNVAKFLG